MVGCYFGDRHYITGKHQAMAKMNMAPKLLRYAGLNQERVAFAQCSSGEASRLVEPVSEFGDKIKELGPMEATAMPLRERSRPESSPLPRGFLPPRRYAG